MPRRVLRPVWAAMLAALALTPRLPAGADAPAPCAELVYVPTLVTDTRQGLPRDPAAFALVLLAESAAQREPYRGGPFGNGFALTRRGRRVPLIVEELGAGVARLRTTTRLGLGLWRVEGLHAPASVNIVGGATLPLPPGAPSEVSLSTPRVRSRAAAASDSREVVAHFAEATPSSSLLLAYWNGALGAAARVRPQDDHVTLFRPDRCANTLLGMRPPPVSAVRELAWLDGFGRMSERVRVP